MAVGRDVVGADGLTNAERYAKRQADKKARQAAFKAQQDAKKTAAAPSVSSPSSMFGNLFSTVNQIRTPTPVFTPAPAPAPAPVIRPVPNSATLSSSPFSSASANEVVNPPELDDYLKNSGTDYGDWLRSIFDTYVDEYYGGPEFDVGDRNQTPDEVAEMKALLDRLNAGESVDLTEIAEDYPEFYSYIQTQYDLEGFDEDILGDTTDDDTVAEGPRRDQITSLLGSVIDSIPEEDDDDLSEVFNEIEGTYDNVIDVLINQAGMSQEEADTLYDLVVQDPTSQAAVTLEGILNREGFSIIGGALITPEENNELFAEDTDGDGFVDAVVKYDANADDGYVQVLGTTDALDAEIAAAQEARENVYNQEGWDDLEPWEQDRDLINAGGNAINGTDGTPPEEVVEEEAEEEVEESVVDQVTSTIEESIDNVTEQFPTWEELWGKIKDSLPSNPQDWGDAIRGILTSAGVNLPSGDIWDILNGGYGVITTGGGSAILNPANQAVFIPGVPVGLPSSSTIIGSVEDLITDPTGTLINKVEQVFGDIVADPGGFVQDLLQGSLDVPESVWNVLIGGAAAGQDVIDWIKNNVGGSEEEVVDDTVIGGTEDEDKDKTKEEETTLVPESVNFGTRQEEDTKEAVEDLVEEVVENPRTNQVIDIFSGMFNSVNNGENVTPDPVVADDALTFGGGSQVFEQQDPAESDRINQVIDVFGGMFNSVNNGADVVADPVVADPVVTDPVVDDSDDFTFGGVPTGPTVEDDDVEDEPFTNVVVEDEDEDDDDFTFGGVPTEPTVEDEPFTSDEPFDNEPFDNEPVEPDPLTGEPGGGFGGGGAGGSVGGSAREFMENLTYNPLVAPSIIPTMPVNFKSPVDAALDDIISGKPLPRENKNMFTF